MLFKKKLPGVTTVAEAVEKKRIQSLLGEGSRNEGSLKLKTGVKIDGTQVGAISLANDTSLIWVSASGEVHGDIDAPEVYVSGVVCGDIRTRRLVLLDGAKLSGRIFADEVVYGNLVGSVSMKCEIYGRKSAKDIDALPTALVSITSSPVFSDVKAA